MQHPDGIAGWALQHPQGVLYALVGCRTVQGVEDVLGLGLAQVCQHRQTEGMPAVQVLERRKHAVDVVLSPVAVAPCRWLDPGQHVENHEAVMPSIDVVAQPFDAATLWKTALHRWPSTKVVEPVQITMRPVHYNHAGYRHP